MDTFLSILGGIFGFLVLLPIAFIVILMSIFLLSPFILLAIVALICSSLIWLVSRLFGISNPETEGK